MGSTAFQVFVGLVMFTVLLAVAVLIGRGLGVIRDAFRQPVGVRQLTATAAVAVACCVVAGAIGYAAASALS